MKSFTQYVGVLGVSGLLVPACGEKAQLAVPDDGGTDAEPVSNCEVPECYNLPPDCVPEGFATGPATTFVVSKLYLGDTDRNGVASPDAWRNYGYDIDGLISYGYTSQYCQPPSGSDPGRVVTDGVKGTDNSFGANVLPALLEVVPDLDSRINGIISKGELSIAVHLEHTGDWACYLTPAQLFIAGDYYDTYHAYPKWDGTDAWPLQCEILETCLPEGTPDLSQNQPRVQFPGSFVADRVWVLGSRGDVDLKLSFPGVLVSLTIGSALITGHLPSALSPATDGVISGVLDPEEFIAQLRLGRGSLSPALCDDQAFEALAQRIRSSADIMLDGSAGEFQTCSGISIGIGFDAVAADLGPVLNERPKGPDSCASGGR